MAKKRFAKDPLLYINQPTIDTPEAPMQHHYHTPKQDRSTESINSSPEKKVRYTRPLKRHDFFAEAESEKQEEKDQDTSEADLSESKVESYQAGQTKFTDMTVQEKIAYFVNKPNEVKLRCEIKTEDQVYQGIITDEEDDHVFIRVGRRATSTKIPIDTILDIRLLGF